MSFCQSLSQKFKSILFMRQCGTVVCFTLQAHMYTVKEAGKLTQ